MMPFGGKTDLQTSQIVTTEEMKNLIETEIGPTQGSQWGKFRWRSAPFQARWGIG